MTTTTKKKKKFKNQNLSEKKRKKIKKIVTVTNLVMRKRSENHHQNQPKNIEATNSKSNLHFLPDENFLHLVRKNIDMNAVMMITMKNNLAIVDIVNDHHKSKKFLSFVHIYKLSSFCLFVFKRPIVFACVLITQNKI